MMGIPDRYIAAQLHKDISIFLRSSHTLGSLVLSLIHQLVLHIAYKPLRSSTVN